MVVIMQENRTFDEYFYSYPGTIGGADQNSSLRMPIDPYTSNSTTGCIRPWLDPDPVTPKDISHDAQGSQIAFDNGLMNGFIANALNENDTSNEPMGYYNNQTIPFVWAYAEHYVLVDMFFSSDMSYSQPNHWYMVAGNSPVVSQYEGANQEEASVSTQRRSPGIPATTSTRPNPSRPSTTRSSTESPGNTTTMLCRPRISTLRSLTERRLTTGTCLRQKTAPMRPLIIPTL